MEWIISRIKQEPVMFQAVIQSLLPMLVALNLINLTDVQLAAAFAFSAAVLGFLTRAQVSPVARLASAGTGQAQPAMAPQANANG